MIETPYGSLPPWPDPDTGLAPPGGGAEARGGRSQATRERILDAAERLFAEHGFAGTSHRQITAEAGVNLAAVNYHFGSKDELFLAAVLRRLEPVNRRRLEMLEEAEAKSDPPRLEEVARAFAEPVVRAGAEEGEDEVLGRLMARAVGEPGGWAEKILPVAFGAVAARFIGALERALPGVKRQDLLWGLVFSAGVLSQYVLMGDVLRRVAGAGAAPPEQVVERMVDFIAAGWRALEAGAERGAGRARKGKKRGKGRKR